MENCDRQSRKPPDGAHPKGRQGRGSLQRSLVAHCGSALAVCMGLIGRLLFAALLLIACAAMGQPLFAGDAPQIAVVVSSNLKPYLEAVQGFQNHLAQSGAEKPNVHFLDPDYDPAHTLLTGKLHSENPALIAAVGPEATDYLWATFPDATPHKLYAMVLNPERVVPGNASLAGVPLNIPIEVQLRELSQTFPHLGRVGLIYDPANNAAFAAAAGNAARFHGIAIIDLQVRSRGDIMNVLESRWKDISALWVIPDATVISESLIHFILKGAIANNVAVFGYNRFFTDSGAALALVCDYEAIGRQTAALALATLAGDPDGRVVPAYEVVVNTRVLKTLGIVPARASDPTEVQRRP
jgi:putative tryptophan/tyrosine transport system substrate-binding protein